MNKRGDAWLTKFKLKMRKNPTPEEKIFNDALKQEGIRFRFQSLCFSKEFQCIVDFLIKCDSFHIAIEIDGEHHSSPTQIEKDNFRTEWLKINRDYDVIRFTNKQVRNDVKGCLKSLASYYINKVAKSESNNFKRFISILNNT